jgi:hypothetical protein
MFVGDVVAQYVLHDRMCKFYLRLFIIFQVPISGNPPVVPRLSASSSDRALPTGGGHRDDAESQRGPEDVADGAQERKSAVESAFHEAQRNHR